MTRLQGEGKLLRIFIGEADRWQGVPLYEAIVRRARREGMAGATVTRGIEGFGADSHLHTARLLSLSDDLPVIVEFVDTTANIERLMPMLDPMITEGMVTVERVEIVTYRGGDAPGQG
jgi:uncharacterized protein